MAIRYFLIIFCLELGVYHIVAAFSFNLAFGRRGMTAASAGAGVASNSRARASGADQTIDEGDTLSGSGSFTDPGADTWTATVNYGEGAGAVALTLVSAAAIGLQQIISGRTDRRRTALGLGGAGGGMPGKVTIRHVAMRAGVAVGTVNV